ncbi:MAG: hypothetical protein ACREBG_01005 [Pyrinomonadaceae bacterium]
MPDPSGVMNNADRSVKAIRPGEPIVVILHTPREKCWGILDEITAAGVFLRGLDLNAFDDWVRALLHDEPFIGLSDIFFPMWRVERLSRDEAAGGIPSLYDQVEQRTGRTVQELMQADQDPLN